MGFLLIDAGFDLPAFVVTENQFFGGSLLWVEQGHHFAMHLARIGWVTSVRAGELSQPICYRGVDAILNDAHA